MPRFVDLSAPIVQSPPGLPDVLRTDIELADPAAGTRAIEAMLGVGPDLLRNGEGWAGETFTRFGTYSSTQVDAPWHYIATIRGERAATVDERQAEEAKSTGERGVFWAAHQADLATPRSTASATSAPCRELDSP